MHKLDSPATVCIVSSSAAALRFIDYQVAASKQSLAYTV
eukprot:COSAG06_NODE_482_length_15147_cov_9.932815_3_plen_39_part_00